VDLERSFRQAAAAIDRIGRTNRVMLIDVRDARGRNEPEFDTVMRRLRPIVEQDMVRVAVLLRSSAGMLQMKRINQEDGVLRMLTLSELEALEFLLE
jgi:Ribonuclease G/E